DRLDRINVVDPLLLALRRDLGLVRPVVELHLRDACDLSDLTQIELDLLQVLGQIYRFKQVNVPWNCHGDTLFESGGTLPGKLPLVRSFEKVNPAEISS